MQYILRNILSHANPPQKIVYEIYWEEYCFEVKFMDFNEFMIVLEEKFGGNQL